VRLCNLCRLPSRRPGAHALSPFPPAGEAQPGGLGREAEELLRQHLKRRHAASILSLKEEFMRKRKKGKLPKDATSSLKTWWTSNLVWPYPSVRAAAHSLPCFACALTAAPRAGRRQALARRRHRPQRHADQQLCVLAARTSSRRKLTAAPLFTLQGSSTSASVTGTRCAFERDCTLMHRMLTLRRRSCFWTARRRPLRRLTECVASRRLTRAPRSDALLPSQGLVRAYGSLDAALAAAQRA